MATEDQSPITKRPRKKLYTLFHHRRGRNTKCTPGMVNRFRDLLLQSLPIDKCCDLVGIHMQSYCNWMERGEKYLEHGGDDDVEEIYGLFYEEVKRARALWQLDLLQREVNPTGYTPGWMKAMTVLERRDRANWGRSEEVRIGEAHASVDEAFL